MTAIDSSFVSSLSGSAVLRFGAVKAIELPKLAGRIDANGIINTMGSDDAFGRKHVIYPWLYQPKGWMGLGGWEGVEIPGCPMVALTDSACYAFKKVLKALVQLNKRGTRRAYYEALNAVNKVMLDLAQNQQLAKKEITLSDKSDEVRQAFAEIVSIVSRYKKANAWLQAHV